MIGWDWSSELWYNKGHDIYLCILNFPRIYLCSLGHNLTCKQNLTFCESVFLLTVCVWSGAHVILGFLGGGARVVDYGLRGRDCPGVIPLLPLTLHHLCCLQVISGDTCGFDECVTLQGSDSREKKRLFLIQGDEGGQEWVGYDWQWDPCQDIISILADRPSKH